MKYLIPLIFILLSVHCSTQSLNADSSDWLEWRGSAQSGVAGDSNTPEEWTPGGANDLWSTAHSGGGTPIIVGSKIYAMGFDGEEPDIRETLTCFDRGTGKVLWKKHYSDFISDIIYNRYGIGSPAVDPETGNIYIHTSPGLIIGLDANGKQLWEVSLMEEFNRLTFPNGRTGGPVIDEDLVIIHGITANWGGNAPARDRFYAFNKYSGELVWYSTPAVQPKDSSFSTPVFAQLGNRRVFYAGTGCGNIVCVDARTGEPIWRYQFSHGGVNSSVVLHGNEHLIAIHGKENLDTSRIGRMISLKIPTEIPEGAKLPIVLGPEAEIWRNDSEAFTSSPVIHGDTVFQVVKTGELNAIDANTGKIKWHLKLGTDQLHASPLWADGKLYVPMFDGKFFIIKDEGTQGRILSEAQLKGACLGAPSLSHGQVFVMSKERLYAFGPDHTARPNAASSTIDDSDPASYTRKAVKLQIVPPEFAMKPGDSQEFKVYTLDERGRRINEITDASWSKFIPPTARVQSKVDAEFKNNTLIAGANAKVSAGAFKAEAEGLSATMRGRVTPALPYTQDFEGFELNAKTKDGIAFAYPPLPWLGARIRWQIIDQGGSRIIKNTLDRILFQRSMNFIGSPEMKNYTMEADVMTDGNRRVMSNVGVINQRYNISLIGNWKTLDIVSNHDRFKKSVPFKWSANKWYRLKTRVDIHRDGSGIIRAKAWPRDEPEPSEWTVEAKHKVAHTHGSPGLYAFSPQSKKSVYIDNIKITPNK